MPAQAGKPTQKETNIKQQANKMKIKENKILKFLLQNDFTTTLLRILPLYLVIFITQVVFYIMNRDLTGNITSAKEFFTLLRGSIVFDNISILYLNSLFIILSLLPLRIRAKNFYQTTLFWLYAITNCVAIICLNLSDCVYFHFAGKRFTFEEIHFLQENTNNAAIVWESVKEHLYLPLIGIALAAGLIYSYRKVKYHATNIKHPAVYYPLCTIILAGSVYLSVCGIRGGFAHSIRPYTLSNAVYYTSSPQKANIILSNPFCVLRTSSLKALDNPTYFSPEETDLIFSPVHTPSPANPADTAFQYKNVVIFVLESFSKEHSAYLCPELYPNGGGYTPFLDSLMRESYTFVNAHANGTKSIEALPSILASIPSYKSSFVLIPQALGDMNPLPKILAQRGYTTSFFCGSDPNSMGFEAFGHMAGIQHFYNKNDFVKKCGSSSLTVEPLWGVFDMPFYLYMEEEISTYSQPFLAAVFNLTSHHPFVVPDDYKDKVPTGGSKVQPCVAYTDMALRRVFSKMRTRPWYQNTIFVFVADHVSPEIASAQTQTLRGRTAIIQFIHTPDHSKVARDSSVTQQLDIMPTLLGMLNYNEPYFAYGRDVYREPNRPHVSTSYLQHTYQYIDDDYSLYFDGTTTTAFYAASDTMQVHNLVRQENPKISTSERYLKAVLQSYYDRIRQKNYLAR